MMLISLVNQNKIINNIMLNPSNNENDKSILESVITFFTPIIKNYININKDFTASDIVINLHDLINQDIYLLGTIAPTIDDSVFFENKKILFNKEEVFKKFEELIHKLKSEVSTDVPDNV